MGFLTAAVAVFRVLSGRLGWAGAFTAGFWTWKTYLGIRVLGLGLFGTHKRDCPVRQFWVFEDLLLLPPCVLLFVA